jgi:phosphonate degradation associated HDIG domain protein
MTDQPEAGYPPAAAPAGAEPVTIPGPIATIAALFASEGAADYLGEPVTQAAHMLQAAALAEQAGAPPPLIASALLHDVGHFTGTLSGQVLMQGTDNRHSDQGADWLAQWFGPEVTEPVRLHVAAKRYLCATDPGYFARLSPASVYTLCVQGGPMRGDELAGFEAGPYAADACQVRRWDDAAKDPDAPLPAFARFGSLLRELVRTP